MDRRELLGTFRERLNEVVDNSGLTRSAFATSTELDRSTLTQLLSSTNRRLPRLETVTQIANAHQVSIDWLMGLSNTGPMQAQVMSEVETFSSTSLAEHEERLLQWFDDAEGYKVRYVPSTVPDLLKTSAVIDLEQGSHVATSPEQKIEVAAARLARTRAMNTDLEVCSSQQSLIGLARGEGIWASLTRGQRLEQLDRIDELTTELYPRLRWFLFDGLERYAAPVTIYGPIRAVLYIGQMYLVMTSNAHIRELTRHFDDHIRGATVQPPDVNALVGELRRELTRTASTGRRTPTDTR